MRELLELAVSAAKAAAEETLKYYKLPIAADLKGDGSPLTIADQSSHLIIMQTLSCSGIPVVSEEGTDLLLDARHYWLVDPLDGTKDFLAGNGEFTINIALVIGARPILGVVCAPVLKELYLGGEGLGAWKETSAGTERLEPRPRGTGCRVAVSRFHDHPDVDVFALANGATDKIALGSALKYGYLASGGAEVFPRLVGSSEWDTAAGQAVLEASGGQLVDWHEGRPLQYGKPRRRNPRLLAFRAPFKYRDFRIKTYSPELL